MVVARLDEFSTPQGSVSIPMAKNHVYVAPIFPAAPIAAHALYGKFYSSAEGVPRRYAFGIYRVVSPIGSRNYQLDSSDYITPGNVVRLYRTHGPYVNGLDPNLVAAPRRVHWPFDRQLEIVPGSGVWAIAYQGDGDTCAAYGVANDDTLAGGFDAGSFPFGELPVELTVSNGNVPIPSFVLRHIRAVRLLGR